MCVCVYTANNSLDIHTSISVSRYRYRGETDLRLVPPWQSHSYKLIHTGAYIYIYIYRERERDEKNKNRHTYIYIWIDTDT